MPLGRVSESSCLNRRQEFRLKRKEIFKPIILTALTAY